MGTDRRGFLQVTGLAALGLVIAKPAIDIFSALQTSGSTASSNASGETTGAAKKLLAMVIDINKCKGSDCGLECQKACHQWHNVPTIPGEEEIKWIWKDTYGRVFEENLIQHVDEEDEAKKALPVMLLCNQCTNPPCVKYCPTRATWKRPEDGIVMVDFHRCIGCRYCMAGCPYGSRSFNWGNPRNYLNAEDLNPEYPTRTRGVVEKCNFCQDRLDQVDDQGNSLNLKPRCVEACTSGALIFGNLLDENDPIKKLLEENQVLRRLPELGTNPNNYYIFGEEE